MKGTKVADTYKHPQPKLVSSVFQLGKELAKASKPVIKSSLDASQKIAHAAKGAYEELKVADKERVRENLIPLATDIAQSTAKEASKLISKFASEGYKAASEKGFNPFSRERKDPKTGQTVYTEAYVVNEDGSRDYESPLVEDTPPLSGLKAKIAGTVLILVGVPMLILPGPGIAAILAGLALLRR